MTENVISIRKHNKQLAKNAFADFMQKTEAYLNDKARANPTQFASLNASKLEQLSVECMKEISITTPFRAEEIRLVSGLSFPDIVTETFYGVEVKSTQSDHWRSIGCSIIESTCNKNVESIYMLFGKLGGQPEVRCRPYEECLYDITVTHSPRYLIDMTIGSQSNIFSKMQTTYDQLRLSPNTIAQVRRYYRNKAKAEKKGEMPWWLDDIEKSEKNPNQAAEQAPKLSFSTSDNMMIRHISTLTQEEKNKLIRQIYILFPSEVIESNFVDPAMWLVAYHKIVCHNMRDFMTAGGQAKYLNDKALAEPIPAIVERLLDVSPLIQSEINYLAAEIDVYNPLLLSKQDLFLAWVEQVDVLLKKRHGNAIPFAQWVANGDRLSV